MVLIMWIRKWSFHLIRLSRSILNIQPENREGQSHSNTYLISSV